MSENLVPEVPPLSRRDLEERATEFVSRWSPLRLEEPGRFPALDAFEDLGNKYPGVLTGVDALSDGIEGICWPSGKVFLSETTYRGLVAGDGRARFTTVHEICHAIHHRRYIRLALIHTGRLVLHRRPSLPSFRDPEWQANAFAAAVLMPERAVRALVKTLRPHSSVELAVQEAFGVSFQAAGVRVEQLRAKGLI